MVDTAGISSAGSSSGASSSAHGGSSGDSLATGSGAATGADGGSANAQSLTTAESIAGQPTTAESIAGQRTTAESLTAESTAPDFIKNELRMADAMWKHRVQEDAAATTGDAKSVVGEALTTGQNYDQSFYSNADKSSFDVQLGREKYSYNPPTTVNDRTKADASVESTFAQMKTTPYKIAGETAQVESKFTVATVGANASWDATKDMQRIDRVLTKMSPEGGFKLAMGAEAIAVEARAEGQLNITPKAVGDSIANAYNKYIDPVVDSIAGRDIPDIPLVPENWDRGVVINAHREVGLGGALKGSVALNHKNDDGDGVGKTGASAKVGLGPVIGAGATIGFK